MSKKDWTSQKVGRLALRVEGDWWVAYYALPNTMNDAIEIARIMMGPVRKNTEHKTAFMELMKNIISDYLKGATGQEPEWPDGIQPAPENERSGRA